MKVPQALRLLANDGQWPLSRTHPKNTWPMQAEMISVARWALKFLAIPFWLKSNTWMTPRWFPQHLTSSRSFGREKETRFTYEHSFDGCPFAIRSPLHIVLHFTIFHRMVSCIHFHHFLIDVHWAFRTPGNYAPKFVNNLQDDAHFFFSTSDAPNPRTGPAGKQPREPVVAEDGQNWGPESICSKLK